MVTESIINPRNTICCLGKKDDFFECTTKPRLSKSLASASTEFSLILKDPPVVKKSSM